MATSGSFGSWLIANVTSISGTWSAAVSRPGTSAKATVTVTAVVNAVGGDYSTYQLEYKTGSTWVKLKEDATSPHYAGVAYTLSGTYTVNVGDTAGTHTGQVRVRAYDGYNYYDSPTGSYSLSYSAKTSYTVKYNANGGTGAPSQQTKYYGTTLTLSSTAPTRSGYTFLGWGTSASAATAVYQPKSSYTANQAITLYAVWKANTKYTVTYDPKGGTGAPASQSGYAGTTITLSTTKPTRASVSKTYTVTFDTVESEAILNGASSVTCTRTTKYTFKEWNTKSDGTGKSFAPGAKLTLNINVILRAIWTETTTGSITLPTATMPQYQLAGWSTSATDNKTVSSPYSPNGNVTLYAVWSSDGNGGLIKLPSDTNLNLSVGSKIRLVGCKDADNDGVYTVASSLYSNGYQYIGFEEDFVMGGTQDLTQYPIKIYGEGSYVPDMDYVASYQNRLWGCSSKTRTIFASALGDPTDFYSFDGVALDAYQVAVATPGNFTGCLALQNCVLFFKEHCIHKMLGSYPAEYTLYTYNNEGVADGNSGSLINFENTAIYIGEHGINTYAGSTAGKLSRDLGEGGMYNSLGASSGTKYILHVKDADEEGHTYILDLTRGIWLGADYGNVQGYAHLNDADYLLSDGKIFSVGGSAPLDDEWEMVFKPFFETVTGSYKSQSHIFETKRYTRLTLRVDVPVGSYIEAEIKADDGEWMMAGRTEGKEDSSQDMIISTPRCDKLQLRLSGRGQMKILAFEREYRVGSRR
jgi:Listeria/Bacterioides repeat